MRFKNAGVRGAGVCLLAAVSGCAFEVDESVDGVAETVSAVTASARADLALRWAPIHLQDVDQTGSHALGGRADFITRVDFDGDANARNNWDNAGKPEFPLAAHAYYSVAETSTHWFIVYMFYHPRDWTDFFFDTEHENDSEGVLMIVARDGSPFGSLRAAVTVAHTDFFSYSVANSGWGSGVESLDGVLELAPHAGALHPVTAQEAKGHGLKAHPHYRIDGDGIAYYPSLTSAEVPSGPNDREVDYRLLDVFAPGGLWEARQVSTLFSSFGSFAGDRTGGCGSGAIACTSNAANAPWGWDDKNDAPARGALALDPAGLVQNYFAIPEAFSLTYTYHPYR